MTELLEFILIFAFVIAGIILLIYATLFFLSMWMVFKLNYYTSVINQVESEGIIHCKYVSAIKWKYGKKGWKARFEQTSQFYKWNEENKKDAGWRK